MIPGFSIQTFLEAFRIFFDVFFPEHVFPFRMEKFPFRMEISPFKHFRSVSNLFLKFVFLFQNIFSIQNGDFSNRTFSEGFRTFFLKCVSFFPEHFLHSEWTF